jgi:hypothetical protein
MSKNINASSGIVDASGFSTILFPATTYGHVQHDTNGEQISAAAT